MPVDATTPADTTTSSTCSMKEQQEPTISTHPDYECHRKDWIIEDDCLAGERTIKDREATYLPMTCGQKQKRETYAPYLCRAIYYNYPRDTVEAALGMMGREPAQITLPTDFQVEDSITPAGDTVQQLINQTNANQMSFGRFGLLVDVPAVENPDTPKILTYTKYDIVTWDEETIEGKVVLKAVILSESGYQLRDGLSYEYVEQYRICALDTEGVYFTQLITPGELREIVTVKDGVLIYNPRMRPDEDPYPSLSGKKLDYVPFQPVNVSNLKMGIQGSPILDICNLSLSLYRKEADKEQTIFMQSQGTPYATGIKSEDAPKMLGSTTFLAIPNPGASVGYLEISAAGLAESRADIEDLKKDIVAKGVSLMDAPGTESGKALGLRISSSTNTLSLIAKTGAEGVRTALAMAYSWTKGTNWEDVTTEELNIVPNNDFVADDNSTVAEEALKLITAKNMGYPLSIESLHQHAQRKELTTMSFEDETELIEKDPLPGGFEV